MSEGFFLKQEILSTWQPSTSWICDDAVVLTTRHISDVCCPWDIHIVFLNANGYSVTGVAGKLQMTYSKSQSIQHPFQAFGLCRHINAWWRKYLCLLVLPTCDIGMWKLDFGEDTWSHICMLIVRIENLMTWQTQSALPSVYEGNPPISRWISKQSSQWIETPQYVMTSSNGNIFRVTGHL